MFGYLKNRFHAYIQGILAEKVDTIAELATMKVNLRSLARQAAEQVDLAVLIERLSERVQGGGVVEYDLLAEHISIEELARQFDISDVAGELDLSDVASNLEASEIADHFALSDIAEEINLSSLAEEFDEDGIAEKVVESLDYKVLAGAILRELRVEPVTVRPSV